MKDYEKVIISSGFNKSDLSLLSLEESDEVIKKIRIIFSEVSPENEELSGDRSCFEYSKLLSDIYYSISNDSLCYIYTDDFKYCGIFLVNARKAIEYALNIAKKDYQNTCFLLDKSFVYSITINYYDKEHSDDPNTFDIQRRKIN